MRSAFLLLLAVALPAITSPIPQDIQGNQQMELQNVSPTPTPDAVPTATGTPSAGASDLSSTNAAAEPETTAMDPALQALAKPPPITADDGMKTGMGAAMAGLGSVTSGLGALPIVGGLGARDVTVTKRWALLESLPVLGPVMGSGLFGRIKRSLWPTLENMPDMGSAGFVNLGHKKRDANLLSSLPLLGGLMGSKTKRQIGGVPGLDALAPLLGILGGIGSKAKRDPAFEALGEVPGMAATLLGALGKPNRKRQIPEIPEVPVVGGLVSGVVSKVGEGVGSGSGIPGLTPRAELPLEGVKKMIAVVADIRGVTSKREAEAAPEQGDFRQGLRKAADEKVEGALNRAEDKTERKAKDKVKDVKLPGQGAIDKREAEALGLDALPAKDLVEGATGLKSTMDLVKNLSSQVENRNGK